MPTLDWLRKEFSYGYDSGDVLSWIPNRVRFKEERRAGGSYRKVFLNAVIPHLRPDSKVMELGPGKGSWSRAILRQIPQGELHTVDFQDVSPWLKPENYNGRLVCHKVSDNSFSTLLANAFDFFWSFGVLCHNNSESIREILKNSLSRMKRGGIAIHQFGDWDKLTAYGWKRGAIPLEFKNKPDNEIWWPRNSRQTMSKIAKSEGWSVVTEDLGLVKRDSMIVLRKDQD